MISINSNISKNKNNQSKWEAYTVVLNKETKMSESLLEYAVNEFKKDIVFNLEPNQYYHSQLQCKLHVIQPEAGLYYNIDRSISYIQFFMKDGDKEQSMKEVFWYFWTTFYEEKYTLYLVSSISIKYKVVPTDVNSFVSPSDVKLNISPKPLFERINLEAGELYNNTITQELEPIEILKYQSHSGYNIPLTMDINKWGYTIFNTDYGIASCWDYKINNYLNQTTIKSLVLYDLNSINTPEYHIQLSDIKMTISLRIKGNEILSFEDELYSLHINTIKGESSLNSFTRTIKDTKYLFIEGVETFMSKAKKVKYISSKKNKDSFKGSNFITMDLETKAIEGKLIPYCVSIFNGTSVSSFYITYFNNSNEMLENAIKSLMRKEYNGYKVYLHNFSYFDGIFLLSIITSLSPNVNILIRDGKIIDLKVNYGNKNKIYFRDSLLMIPMSLDKAAKSFNVENKGYFPYKFVNKPETKYDYIGPVPTYDYFEENKVTKEAYIEYVKSYNGIWDLEKETIKYCEQDCITLYQVLQKFSDFIYDEFKINFLNSPTLSSLAFLIYRTNFMEELDNKLPILTGKIYTDIKKSYTGGAVDVYLPYGENLYLYDINSLYPSVMKEFPMPVGEPTYF